MLYKAHLCVRMSFSEFAARYGRDERFKAIDKMRDRELLFNEVATDMRRRDTGNDSATLQSEKVCSIVRSYCAKLVLS